MHIPQLALAAVALRSTATKPLFPPWNASEWRSQDDSVRGNGASFSFLDILTPNSAENPYGDEVVKFRGNLNYTALGGAGFASQRTVDEWPELDISEYDELVLEIPYTDGKKYTLNLKDTVPPAGTNDLPTISWGYDFQLPATVEGDAGAEIQQTSVLLKDLVPTFNGRVVNNSAPLNTTSRPHSFFAQQQGDFELQVKSLVARKAQSGTKDHEAVH